MSCMAIDVVYINFCWHPIKFPGLNVITHSVQVGRKLVYRSEPPVLKRKQKEKDEQKQREEEELQYFFS